MTSVPDIFDAMGGNANVAAVLGIKPSAASEMKRRQSIPVRYWPTLVDEARKRGVALDYKTLVGLHSEKAA